MSDEHQEKVKQVIVVRKDLHMRAGKIGAQCSHAALKFLLDNNESERPDELLVKLSVEEATWCFNQEFKKVVLAANSEDELNDLILKAQIADVAVYPIVDSGLTEFHGVPTLTCAAFGPDLPSVIDPITGYLKPL